MIPNHWKFTRIPAYAWPIAVILVVSLSACQQVHATILWNWSFGGTESGTFETDGDLIAGAAPPGTYDESFFCPGCLHSFTYDTSSLEPPIPVLGNPPFGGWVSNFDLSVDLNSFDWDGSNVTAWRNGGGAQAGWTSASFPARYHVFFGAGPGDVSVFQDNTPILSSDDLVISPVPEPTGLVLMVIGAVVVLGTTRRRGAAHRN